MTSSIEQPWIYLYDETRRDLGTSLRQLRNHGIGLDEIGSYESRLDLFADLEGVDRRVVVLIDLQSHDRHDQSYSGHRIIETIRRHPALARNGRPLAYTVHARPDVVALARRHGALALVSKTDLDAPDDEIPNLGLAGFLRRMMNLEREAIPAAFAVFPDTTRAEARYKRTREDVAQALDRVLVPEATTSETRQPFFWDVIRYLADGLEQSSAAYWVSADNPDISPRQVTKSLERLRPIVAHEYRVGAGVDWQTFGADLLELVPQHRSAPTLTRTLRALIRVNEIEDLLTSKDLRRRGYLDAHAVAALDRVLAVDPSPVPRPRGNEGRWKHTEDLLATLVAVEPASEQRAALTAAFVRGVNNVYATYVEDRDRARPAAR